MAEISEVIDVDAIQYARNTLRQAIAVALGDDLQACYQQLNVIEPYEATADAIARRDLKNTALQYLMLLDDAAITEQCCQQFALANNMTDKMAALTALVHHGGDHLQAKRQQALSSFYDQWQHEPLVVNEWLSVQASVPSVDTLAAVKELMTHQCFSLTNPNKVRALLGSFTRNMLAFHQASGEGYRFLGEQIIALNSLNPQIAARMLTPLTRWRKYDDARQKMMRSVLLTIRDTPKLSKDVFEVVDKSL